MNDDMFKGDGDDDTGVNDEVFGKKSGLAVADADMPLLGCVLGLREGKRLGTE